LVQAAAIRLWRLSGQLEGLGCREIGFLVVFLAWTAFMLLPFSASGHELGSTRWTTWLSIGLIAAILFANFTRKRTRGGWNWHWGGKPLRNHTDD